jgi:hypothetical protein
MVLVNHVDVGMEDRSEADLPEAAREVHILHAVADEVLVVTADALPRPPARRLESAARSLTEVVLSVIAQPREVLNDGSLPGLDELLHFPAKTIHVGVHGQEAVRAMKSKECFRKPGWEQEIGVDAGNGASPRSANPYVAGPAVRVHSTRVRVDVAHPRVFGKCGLEIVGPAVVHYDDLIRVCGRGLPKQRLKAPQKHLLAIPHVDDNRQQQTVIRLVVVQNSFVELDGSLTESIGAEAGPRDLMAQVCLLAPPGIPQKRLHVSGAGLRQTVVEQAAPSMLRHLGQNAPPRPNDRNVVETAERQTTKELAARLRAHGCVQRGKLLLRWVKDMRVRHSAPDRLSVRASCSEYADDGVIERQPEPLPESGHVDGTVRRLGAHGRVRE